MRIISNTEVIWKNWMQNWKNVASNRASTVCRFSPTTNSIIHTDPLFTFFVQNCLNFTYKPSIVCIACSFRISVTVDKWWRWERIEYILTVSELERAKVGMANKAFHLSPALMCYMRWIKDHTDVSVLRHRC